MGKILFKEVRFNAFTRSSEILANTRSHWDGEGERITERDNLLERVKRIDGGRSLLRVEWYRITNFKLNSKMFFSIIDTNAREKLLPKFDKITISYHTTFDVCFEYT